MSNDHSKGVTRNYLAVENSLEEGYWDDVFRETSYFECQASPAGDCAPGHTGLEVGEFDVLAVNYDDQVFLYVEVKTNGSDLSYAEEQLDRAEEFFSPEWEMIGQTWLEQ